MKTSSSSQRHFLQQAIVVSCPVSNALFLLPSLSSSWYTLCRMDHLAGVHIWPDQSGSQMVFFGQVPWEQKGGCKNGYCPVVFWTHEPLLGLSQPVQSLAACFMPPKVLANEMPFEDRAGPLCSDWHLPGQHTDNVSCWKPDSSSLDSFHAHPFQFFSTCILYSIPLPLLSFLTFSNPFFYFFFTVAHILFFLFFPSFPLCRSPLCMCGRILSTAYRVCECATNLSSRCSIQRRIKESFHFSKINSFGQEKEDAHQTGC